LHCQSFYLNGLGSLDLGAGEVTSKDGLEEGSEYNLCTAEYWESEPQSKDKLEGVVEWEPVDGIDGALKQSQEGKNDPVSQPLCIIGLGCAEQSLKGVVPRNSESSEIGQELSCNVEEDEEEVCSNDTKEGICLGDTGLPLEVGEGRVFRQLFVDLGDVVLGTILERHIDGFWSIWI